jgi:hypothetical protein
VVAASAVRVGLSLAECSGEHRPVLGSGRQAFAVRGCPLRFAGPLIGVKKAIGLYDPRSIPVIK